MHLYETGFVYAMYLTGPWLGYKSNGRDGFGWVGLGKHRDPEIQVWRHSCVR